MPSYTIKALAREFAKRVTSIMHSFGGSMIRGPYSSEPARLEVVLLAMQGLGKPGVHQENWWKGFPRSVVMPTEATEARQGSMYGYFWPPPPQVLPKTLIEKAIFSDEPFTFWGSGAQICPTSDQLKQYTYPIPKEEGGSKIHMIWSDTPCRTTCWGFGNKVAEGLQHPSIECVVVQHPWLENDTLFADIILPVNTKLEEQDFGIDRDAQYFSVFLEDKSLEPVGESKSDYEAVCEVAKAMGLFGEFTKGKTVEEWIKTAYELSGVKDLVSWEELREKSYYVVPIAPDWEKDKPGMHAFVADPQANPLQTPSGLLEIYSEALATTFPCDLERPPIPKWVERGETHDERLSSLARQEVSAADVLEPSAVAAACAVRRYPLDPRSAHRQGEGHRRLHVRAGVAEPAGGREAGHQVRRHRQGLQRARHRARRRLRDRTHPYPGRLHGSRRALRLDQDGRDRPGRRAQPHLSHRYHLQERLRSGHERLPGRGGEAEPGGDAGVAGEVSGIVREGIRPEFGIAFQRLAGLRTCF